MKVVKDDNLVGPSGDQSVDQVVTLIRLDRVGFRTQRGMNPGVIASRDALSSAPCPCAWPGFASPASRFWLVDPLDGTREFVARNGEFAVLIGLIEDGRPVLGVVHGPAIGLTYTAHGPGTAMRRREGGAFEPIRARTPASEGIVVVHSRSHENSRRLAEYFEGRAVIERQKCGSALKFGVLAAGEADFYPRFGTTMEWDTAAGQAILEAAGGRVETFAVFRPLVRDEADPIIDLMSEFAISSLLRRGTKTWHGRDYETTIDLVLASEELTTSMVKCAIYRTEHGSDHRAIDTVFDALVPSPKHQERLLLRNAPWKKINARMASTLEVSPSDGTAQQETDRLMSAVLEAVHALTPKARPSPYAKRWWTANLTQLRQIYTY
jgi:3'(2'),5'-bisphosphate nucleotidase